MMARTPEPWSVEDEGGWDGLCIYAALGVGGLIATVCRTPDPENDGTDNARLLAAGPSLLAACKAIRPFLDDLETEIWDRSAIDEAIVIRAQIDAAVAAAEGREATR